MSILFLSVNDLFSISPGFMCHATSFIRRQNMVSQLSYTKSPFTLACPPHIDVTIDAHM